MKVEMIKNSAKLYKDSDFHQPNEMTMKKKKANSFHLIFSNHFASCFNLIKLLGGEFPYIISSFSILRKVFWGMCRSEFFDKSLEKEIYWLKGKKMILFYYMIAKTTIHPSTVSVATDGYLPRLFFTARQISTSSHSHLGAGE